jgi:hypothetical protein
MPDNEDYQAQPDEGGHLETGRGLGRSEGRSLYQEPSFEDDDTSRDAGESRTYAGKYKTVDDLEKGYKEAERKIHENSQSTSQLKRQLDELAVWKNQMEQAFGGRRQMSEDEYRQLASEAMENDPVGYINHVINNAITQTRQQSKIEESAKDAYMTWISKDENKQYGDPDMQVALGVAIQQLNANPQTAYLDPYAKLTEAKNAVEKWIETISDKKAKAKLNAEMGLNAMAAFESGSQTPGKAPDENKGQSYNEYLAERQKARERIGRR